jgi:hypothetical protein
MIGSSKALLMKVHTNRLNEVVALLTNNNKGFEMATIKKTVKNDGLSNLAPRPELQILLCRAF